MQGTATQQECMFLNTKLNVSLQQKHHKSKNMKYINFPIDTVK